MAEPSYPVPKKLWEHPNVSQTAMNQFQTYVEAQNGYKFRDWHDFYEYSITKRSDFWLHIFRYMPYVYTLDPQLNGQLPDPCVDESARMDSVPKWFKGVSMNFAESVLFTGDGRGRPTTLDKEDSKIAVTEVREGSYLEPIRHVSWSDLRARVGRLASAMRNHGVRRGDRVAVVASNSVDTLVCFLAITTLGGLFSSSSTDMGVSGILDRLLQITPRYVFIDDWSIYNGKKLDLRHKIREVVEGMSSVPEFKGVVVQPRFADMQTDLASLPKTTHLSAFLQASTTSTLQFEKTAFSDPFLIVYSSGTTGQPKCIVHSIGGVILNSHKESRLHRCIDPTSIQLQYTTTGWIMYLVAISTLLTGARSILYDGSPFLPTLKSFIHLLSDLRVTHLGTSPRYLQTLETAKLTPKSLTDLTSLKVVTSTGMVLPEAQFLWFYTSFPAHVQLDNISGGTDLAGSFGTGNPVLPVYAGGCQSASLGTPVRVYDQTEGGRGVKGAQVADGVPGELVADKAFPNMPVMFWGRDGATRYFDSYFARFDDVWVHGDFIMVHPVTRNLVFLGRADGVLNPSGVRFGSAEIYNIVDNHFGQVVSDSICVGQRRPADRDERVMLFLLMKEGHRFTEDLVGQIRAVIKKEAGPRHVPSYVFETPEIPVRFFPLPLSWAYPFPDPLSSLPSFSISSPSGAFWNYPADMYCGAQTTVNLKKVELPVKQIVSGRVIKPSGTLLNPQSLEYYYQFANDEVLDGKKKVTRKAVGAPKL